MARVIAAGTYDPTFSHNRKLIALLEAAGHEVVTCQVDLWGDERHEIPQQRKADVLVRAVLAYPRLIWRFLRIRRGDAVIVLHPGWFDMIVLAPLAKLRRMPVLFNAFISLYDTVVSDRKLASADSFLGKSLRVVDRSSLRLASRVLADTPGHADYFAELADLPRDRIGVVWVGAWDRIFTPRPEIKNGPPRVLFYGTFIALHGLETIIRAAKLVEADGIAVRIIGHGQEQPLVDRLLDELAPANVETIERVPLEQLPNEIAAATICLGVFGTSDKAHRVVPHKVFECAAVGRPIITGDTEGVRTAFDENEVMLTPPGDATALAEAIRSLMAQPDLRDRLSRACHERYVRMFSFDVLTKVLDRELETMLGTK
jgi:glycosyltransferase involved in cell wall biosynthesis